MPTACPAKTWLKLIFPLAQTDAPATSDHDGFVVERIVDVGQAGIGPRRRLVAFPRAFHVQSFVGAFVVEDLDKFVEARLLLKKIGGRRFSGFFLQCQMGKESWLA
jgi:hypothetical protein